MLEIETKSNLLRNNITEGDYKTLLKNMEGYMIKIEEFDNFDLSDISYDNHGGSKKGILINIF